MRLLRNLGLWAALTSASVTAQPLADSCATACIDIFGGTLPIPAGYRLQVQFGDVLRLVRIDRDPRAGHGDIEIGKAESLPSRMKRERSARDLAAAFTSESRGRLRVDITTRTTEPLLASKPVRYVSALIYDDRHYMRITESNPDLWKQIMQQCMGCGS